MSNINVAIIHGIGVTNPGYSLALRKGVNQEFNNIIRRLLGSTEDYTDYIRFKEIVWDDILGKNQEKLKLILERTSQQKRRTTFLGFLTGMGFLPIIIAVWLFVTIFKHPIIFLFAFLVGGYLFYRFGTKLYDQLRTGFASESVMDIIGYLNKEAKQKIQQRIKDDLSEINGDKQPVTFISHSLGTVIASDFVWDRQDTKDFGNFSLSNFFTMGSPLALFALRYGAELFNKPLRIDDDFGCWVNILDKDDPIAYPLKELNKEYNDLILEDKEVDVGFFGIAHIKYWTNDQVHKIIAQKLALDWLRLNNKLNSDGAGSRSIISRFAGGQIVIDP